MPRSRADIVLEWEKLSAAYKANQPGLAGLEPVIQELDTLQAEVRTLGIQQDAQQAAVQQTTKEIEERVARGTLLATRVRSAAKAIYGTRTEKVLEFGVRPFRKRTRAPKIVFIEKEPGTSPQETTPQPPQAAKPTT